MAYVESNGGRLFWDSRGSGPAVFLTHGYSVTGDMWNAQAPLGDAFRLITWDMRGHGRSDSPDDQSQYTEEKSVQDMVRILDEAGEKKAILGGLSLGGYLSLAFYQRHPERVKALVLCDTGPGFKDPAARAKWNARAEATALGLERGGLDSVREIQDKVVSVHQTALGLIRSARGLFRQEDSRIIESLPAIRVPTLVVVGENDEALLAGCHYMAKKIPGAGLVVVPRSGHYPNVDEPEIFNRALRAFLESVGG